MERVKRTSRLLAAIGVTTMLAGGVMLVTTVTSASGATPTLSLTDTAAGASCNNSNPAAPVCTGVAGGQTVTVAGTGFAAGALASIVQCNSDPAQPVISFLGNDIPVSCSPLAIVTIPSSGANKGKLSGTHKLAQGTVGPPVAATPDLCSDTAYTPTTIIPGCTLGASPAADAAAFPCPPTAAQQAAGDTCVLAIGDANGDRAIGTILFGTETLPSTTVAGGTTTTGAGGTTTTGAGGTTTTGAGGTTTTTEGGTTTTTEGGTTTTTEGGTTTTTEGGTTTTTTEGGTTTTTTEGGTTTTTTAPPGPPLTLSSSSVQAGSPVTVTGSGFAADETVDLAINDAPTAIGQTTSDDNGNISVAVTIPSGTAPGTYPITATGETSGVVDTVNVTITAATTVALTGPYELYCPGTPVGTIALNDVKTSASISPSTVSNGTSFTVTGYQTVATLPGSLATAAAALGSASITGSAVGQIDVTGGTPATMATGTESFNLAIPSPVPSSGLTLTVPSSPLSLGPFTAQGSAVTVQNDSITNLTLVVSGANLALKCTAYTNNSVASGIVTATPSGQPIDPIIAIAGGGAPPITPAATAKTTTTGPVTAPSSKLAFTGPGPGVGVIGILGAVLVLIGIALLVLVDVPRRVLSRLAVVAPSQWQRMRGTDVADRLAILNPMRWRRGHSEGVPDAAGTTVTAPVAPSAPAQGPATATQVEGGGDRLARTAEIGRDLAVNTTRAAVRAAHWLLGR